MLKRAFLTRRVFVSYFFVALNPYKLFSLQRYPKPGTIYNPTITVTILSLFNNRVFMELTRLESELIMRTALK